MTTLKMAWIETKLFFREPVAVVLAFAFPFFVLFVLGGVFGNDPPVDEEDRRVWRGVAPTQYYLPAYVGLVMASIGLISLPLRLAAYREQGVLRRFRAAGMPLTAIMASQALVAIGVAIAGGVGITIASGITYGTDLPADWPGTVVAFTVSALAFCAIGLLLGGILPTARAAQGAGLTLFFVMMFICGAGPPREVLTSGMRTFSDFLPLTHVILALQDPWLGYGWPWSELAIVSGILAACLALTAWRFRWE